MISFPTGKTIFYSFVLACSVALLLSQISCSTPAGNPDNGKKWYNKNNCFFCHGDNGKNGKAPVIAGLKLSYRAFKNKLRKPNSTIMPTFSEKEVSAQDVADIYAWLKSNP